MAFSIGQVAQKVGISCSSLRYYEAEGLIAPAGRVSGRRVYDAQALDRISFVARARDAGLGIADIRNLLQLYRGIEPLGSRCSEVRNQVQDKVAELDRQIEQAQALRSQLVEALQRDCAEQGHCPVP